MAPKSEPNYSTHRIYPEKAEMPEVKSQTMPSLTFLGAAGTVTGSKHLLDTGTHRVLVDCGLFQGLKELRERNWQPLPIAASAIDAVDPDARASRSLRLSAAAGRARVSRDACSARRARGISARSCCPTRRTSRKKTRAMRTGTATRSTSPALPLYTANDAERALSQLAAGRLQPASAGRAWRRRRVHQRRPSARLGVRARHARRARRFSSAAISDGTADRCCPIPLPIDRADVLLVESTYGDRLHEPDDHGDRLAAIVNAAVARRGKLIIPAFAIGRVEEVIYWLKRLEDEKRDPGLARLRRQPDGGASACSSTRSAPTSSIPKCSSAERGVCALLHDAHDDRVLGRSSRSSWWRRVSRRS